MRPPSETELAFRFGPPFVPNPSTRLRLKLGDPNLQTRGSGQSRREREADDQPTAGGVGGADGPAVRLGDLAHDRQPEARAVLPARRARRGRSGRRRARARPRARPGRGRAPRARRRAAPTSTTPPGGRAPRRCRAGCRPRAPSRSGTPSTTHGSSSAPKRTRGGVPARARHRLARRARRARTSSTGGSPLVAAGELDQVADEPAELLGLLDHVAQRAARRSPSVELAAGQQDLDVGAQAVTGVRSSCEASATSRRCARLRAPAARSSIALKRCAIRPTSSSPRAPMRRPRSSSPRCARPRRQLGDRPDHRAREQARRAPPRARCPRARAARAASRRRPSARVDALERAAELHRAQPGDRRR